MLELIFSAIILLIIAVILFNNVANFEVKQPKTAKKRTNVHPSSRNTNTFGIKLLEKRNVGV
jgi:uncharacterized membrane protein